MKSRWAQAAWVVLTTALVQLFILFVGHRWVAGGYGFYWPHFVARLGVPAVVAIAVLDIPFGELGIAWPEMRSERWIKLGAVVSLIFVAILSVRLSPDFLRYYSDLSGTEHMAARMAGFALFVLSTIPPWEWLHRGFLLFGLLRIFREKPGRSDAAARWRAILVVCAFETVFHLAKPPIEVVGMMLGSPVLSIVALRTKSILIPLAIHLLIETVFVLVVMLGS